MLGRFGGDGCCRVFANAVDECLLIRKRQQLRHGKIALPSLEQLEALINGKRNAGEGDYINEADYVVETLLKGDLVDPQILLAIRRSFYWKAHAASDGKRNSLITSEDLPRVAAPFGIVKTPSQRVISMPDSRRRCGRRRIWPAPRRPWTSTTSWATAVPADVRGGRARDAATAARPRGARERVAASAGGA